MRKKRITKMYRRAAACIAAVCMMLSNTAAVSASDGGANTPKEENIYVNLNADGSVDGIYVVNAYQLSGPGMIVDYGSYETVRNLSSESELKIEGDRISAEAEEGKFFYQGNLKSKDIPWEISIRYYLDDKEVKAEELAGKGGAFRMEIHIGENQKAPAAFFDNYLMQVTVTMNMDKCTHLQAEGATVGNVGTTKQLIYNILAGQEKDIIIRADVSDFEMDPIAMQGVPMSFDIDADAIDKSALYDKTDEIRDAAEDFDEGAARLDDGVEELTGGAADLDSGAAALYDGAKKVDDGAGELQSGARELNDGAASLKDGAGTLKNGAGDVRNGAGQLKDGAADLRDGAGQVKNGAGDVKSGAGDVKMGAEGLKTGAQAVAEGAAGLNQGIVDMKAGVDALAEAFNPSAPTPAAPGMKNLWSTVYGTYNSLLAALPQTAAADNSLQAAVEAGLAAVRSDLEGYAGTGDYENQYQATAASRAQDVGNGVQAAIDNVNPSREEILNEVRDALGNAGVEDDSGEKAAQIAGEICSALSGPGVDTGALADEIKEAGRESFAEGYRSGASYALDQAGFRLGEALGAVSRDAGSPQQLAAQLAQALQALQPAMYGMENYVVSADQGIGRLQEGMNTLQAGSDTLVQGSAGLYAGTDALAQGAASLYAGTDKLSQGAESLYDGTGTLAKGADSLYSGAGSLADGAQNLYNGTETLADGSSCLLEGADSMKSGAEELYNGTNDLKSGTDDLLSGAAQLKDGTMELKDGAAQFRDKTADIDTQIEDEIDNLIGEFSGGDFHQVSYISDKNKNVDLVQFALKTDGIRIPETKPADVEAEPVTIWERIVNLFR